MKLMGWIILLGLALLVAFAVANWTLFTAPHTLDLLFMQVSAPLALILLGATLAFVAVFTIYALSLRTATLVETRRQFKELEAPRSMKRTPKACAARKHWRLPCSRHSPRTSTRFSRTSVKSTRS